MPSTTPEFSPQKRSKMDPDALFQRRLQDITEKMANLKIHHPMRVLALRACLLQQQPASGRNDIDGLGAIDAQNALPTHVSLSERKMIENSINNS